MLQEVSIAAEMHAAAVDAIHRSARHVTESAPFCPQLLGAQPSAAGRSAKPQRRRERTLAARGFATIWDRGATCAVRLAARAAWPCSDDLISGLPRYCLVVAMATHCWLRVRADLGRACKPMLGAAGDTRPKSGWRRVDERRCMRSGDHRPTGVWDRLAPGGRRCPSSSRLVVPYRHRAE